MTRDQIYWEDIAVGNEVPPLAKVATTQTLVKWAGACGDFNPLHYDNVFAASQGVGKSIIHGPLKRAWLVQLMTNWIGEEGFLKSFSCQFRAIDYPYPMKDLFNSQEEEPWWCRGRVTGKYVKANEHYADCEIWIENDRGEVTTKGYATVMLPYRTE
jgi:hypothetical protein